MTTKSIRNWFGWGMLILLIVCLISWYSTRDTLPQPIRIATGQSGGLYFGMAKEWKPLLEERTGHNVLALESNGTIQNCELLRNGQVDLAILQAGAGDTSDLCALAPLYYDVVHVIVRKSSFLLVDDNPTKFKFQSLIGKSVSLGPEGSGMRQSALQILAHYQVDVNLLHHTEKYFMSLAEINSAMDAAIVTTGMPNPDLRKLLSSGEFILIPIADADALHILQPHFTPVEIPHGLYAAGLDANTEPVPGQTISTVGTTSYLAARTETSAFFVNTVLESLYQDYQPLKYPPIAPVDKAGEYWTIPLHPTAVSFRYPYRGLEVFGQFMESVAALKELFFALVAILYFSWTGWRNLKENEEQRAVSLQKEELDEFLAKTIEIERAHMKTSDPDKLREYMNEVTSIKLKALEELTHERLRGDRTFAIFLTQCANLIRKIQEKCIFHLSINLDDSILPQNNNSTDSSD